MLANPAARDAIGVGLIIALAMALLAARQADGSPYLSDVAGQMASYYLLPAMAFCLALRCGAIDLSVWVNTALGGLTAAVLINHGWSVGWSFAAGAAAGLGVGLVNASLVALAHLPSLIVTPLTAAATLWVMHTQFDQRAVPVPTDAFEHWLLTPEMPLLVGRMLLVAGVYGLTMLGLLALEIAARRNVRFAGRQSLFAALCVSGVLSALGGACWLLDHGAAPVPTRLIGDLRTPAVAGLAGAAFFAGRGRTLLSCVCLPAAMLLATVWRQQIWNLQAYGYAMQTALLAGMTLVVHLAAANWLSERPAGGKLSAGVITALAAVGILVVAASAVVAGPDAKAALCTIGLGLSLAGAAGLITAKTLRAFIHRKAR